MAMVDSVGRAPVGRSHMVGRRRRDFLLRTIQKMEQWRDAARQNLLRQRERYKAKVQKNKALMKAKKDGNLPNLNPSSFPSKLEVGFNPKSVHRFEATHSTVPLRPKYSIVKPSERIYGNKWKLREAVKLEKPKTKVGKGKRKKKVGK